MEEKDNLCCIRFLNYRQALLPAADRENEPAFLLLNSLSLGGPSETGPHKRWQSNLVIESGKLESTKRVFFMKGQIDIFNNCHESSCSLFISFYIYFKGLQCWITMLFYQVIAYARTFLLL